MEDPTSMKETKPMEEATSIPYKCSQYPTDVCKEGPGSEACLKSYKEDCPNQWKAFMNRDKNNTEPKIGWIAIVFIILGCLVLLGIVGAFIVKRKNSTQFASKPKVVYESYHKSQDEDAPVRRYNKYGAPQNRE